MSNTTAEHAEQGHEGLGFGTLLRDCLASGLLLVRKDGTVADLTPEAERILGVNASQLLNRPLDQLPVPLREIISQLVAAAQATRSRHLRLRAGTAAEMNLQITAISCGQSPDGGTVIVLNDLTPVRRLEQNMRRVDRLASIGTLSAGMAHEIKNALVAVKTFVDLLLEKNPDAELAGVVRREMGRIDSLVSQMLGFAGPARPAFSPVRMHEILEHSLRMVRQQIDGAMVSLDCSFRAAPDVVVGDDYQLEQAFMNLLLNALESMGANGKLSVATETVDGAAVNGAGPGERRLRVSICDTGTGIPAENLERLFEPFFTTKPNGTGLGLPIARRIIQEHRGIISIQSEPGHGTTFQVELPLMPPAS